MSSENWETLAPGIGELCETLIEQATVAGAHDRQEDIEQRRALIRADFEKVENLAVNYDMADKDFWRIVATKPFYAGHKACAVQDREPDMLAEYLGDRKALCSPDWDINGPRYKAFLSDKRCFRHAGNLNKTVQAAWQQHSNQSIVRYYLQDQPEEWSNSALKAVHVRLQESLKLGRLTTFHLMTELGLPVVKPDRVLIHVSVRMGLIRSYFSKGKERFIGPDISREEAKKLGQSWPFIWPFQEVHQKLAKRTGLSMRLLDLMIVKLGQDPHVAAGFARTICRTNDPLCHLCSVKPDCRYANQFSSNANQE